MLAAYPKATRPITALPRAQSIVQSFAVLSVTGVGALAAVGISIASSTTAMSGVGAFNPAMVAQASSVLSTVGAATQTFTLQGNASAVFNTAGLGDFTAPSIVTAFMALSAAGIGNLSTTSAVITSSSMSVSGTGSFAPVMTAQVFADASFAGSGDFGASDSPASEARFEGVGSFSAVGYVVILDSERACLHQELRNAQVLFENRIAIVPFEDRVYRIAAARPGAGNQPRKRTC
jgi:hypothetical protein